MSICSSATTFLFYNTDNISHKNMTSAFDSDLSIQKRFDDNQHSGGVFSEWHFSISV